MVFSKCTLILRNPILHFMYWMLVSLYFVTNFFVNSTLILNVMFGGRNIFFSSFWFLSWFSLLFGDWALFLMMVQLVEKQRLIEFAEALRSRLNYFDELENVRFGKCRCHITKIFIFYFMKKIRSSYQVIWLITISRANWCHDDHLCTTISHD